MNNFVLFVAFRYFQAKKNEKFVSIISAFSLLGVMLGVAALIVVMSVMNGFHRELVKNIIGLNGDIIISSDNGVIHNYESILKILSTQKYVAHVTPNIIGQTLIMSSKANQGALVRGIDVKYLKSKAQILNNVVDGSFMDFHGYDVVAIGSELAHNLGVRVGDKLKLISPNTVSTAFGITPRFKEFTVVAKFKSGMYDYDTSTVLMPFQAAKKFLAMPDDVATLIEISTTDHVNPFESKVQMMNVMNNTKYTTNIFHNLRFTTWQESNTQFFEALKVERVAMFTILSLILVVAAFNILSSLFMLVKDKTFDIAILRTLGASTRQIMLIFVCNGLLIGCIGIILGTLLGVSFASNIESIRKWIEKLTGFHLFEAANYFLYQLPSEVHVSDVWTIIVLSFILCLFSTLYPSYQASKLNPIDTMRYE